MRDKPHCSVAGCEKGRIAKGFCRSHYEKDRHEKDPLRRVSLTEKTLSWKAANPEKVKAAQVRRAVKYRTDPEYREKMLTRFRVSYADNAAVRLQRRNYALKQKGFSVALVDQLRRVQNGCCAICSREMKRTRREALSEYADHDHETMKPRGLLCMICNTSLGSYEKHQRPAGLRIPVYDCYLAKPPVSLLSVDDGSLGPVFD